MPCRWKSQGFDSGEDCVSRMTGKVDDPEAFCYGPAEGYNRHPDFNKIYKQFLNYENGHKRYYDWIKALKLDETTSYMNNSTNRERFDWTQRHIDLQMWKEDNQAKYWKVEAGFPVESMNANVYTLDECQEAARTLAHKQVNLNHKHILPTVEIPAAKFEDGIVEAVLRVPKNLYCPICEKNKTINNLIEEGKIVNVSIEAVCTLQSDDPHKCEGMEFTGLSLLTTASLPGIPLTRLMPLESIMVEALQTSTKNFKEKKRVKIKAIVKEQEETPSEECPEGEHWSEEEGKCIANQPKASEQEEHECGEGEIWDSEQGKCVPKPQEDYTNPDQTILSATAMLDPVRPPTPPATTTTVLGTPAAPDGNFMQSGPEYAHKGAPPNMQNIPKEKWREWFKKYLKEAEYPWAQCIADRLADGYDQDSAEAICGQIKAQNQSFRKEQDMPKPEDIRSGPTRTSQPGRILLKTTIGGEVEEPGSLPSPTGQPVHVVVGTSPVEALPSLEENVARIKAEIKAKSAEEQVLIWQQKYNEVYGKLGKKEGQYIGLSEAFDKLNERSLHAESAKKEAEFKYNEQCGLVTDLKRQLDKTTNDLTETNKKYSELLKTSLDLNERCSKANEDYLDMAKKAENLEDKLAEARKDAKKIVRIRV